MQCRFSEYEIRFTDNDSSPVRTKNRDFGLRQTQNELAKDGLILNDARGYAAHILDLDPMLVSPDNASLAAELKKDKYQSRDYSRIS